MKIMNFPAYKIMEVELLLQIQKNIKNVRFADVIILKRKICLASTKMELLRENVCADMRYPGI